MMVSLPLYRWGNRTRDVDWLVQVTHPESGWAQCPPRAVWLQRRGPDHKAVLFIVEKAAAAGTELMSRLSFLGKLWGGSIIHTPVHGVRPTSVGGNLLWGLCTCCLYLACPLTLPPPHPASDVLVTCWFFSWLFIFNTGTYNHLQRWATLGNQKAGSANEEFNASALSGNHSFRHLDTLPLRLCLARYRLWLPVRWYQYLPSWTSLISVF